MSKNYLEQHELPRMLQQDDVSSELFDLMMDTINLISRKYSNCVSGLWYLNNNCYDDIKRFVIRTSIPYGTKEYLMLEAAISHSLHDCILYDYYQDLCGESEFSYTDLTKEFEEGKALTVYYANIKE